MFLCLMGHKQIFRDKLILLEPKFYLNIQTYPKSLLIKNGVKEINSEVKGINNK